MKEHSALGFRDQNSVGYSQVNDEQLDSFLRDIVKNTQIQEKERFRGILLAIVVKFKSEELGHH